MADKKPWESYAAQEGPWSQYQPKAKAPSTERTFGEATKDIGADVIGGIGSLIALPGQLAGLVTGNMQDSTSMELGKELQQYGEEMKSAGLKAREAERARKIAESAKEGQFQAFGTALGETVKDPALLLSFLAQQAPQLLVPFAAARGVGAAAKGLGATEAVASKAAVRGAVGAGGVQQGSDVGANAYENIYKELKSKGATDTEAAEGALTLARQAGAAAGTISLLAQRLPGARQLEEVLAGVPGKGAAGLGGRLKTAGGAAAGETLGEIPEEVGGKFVSNLAMQQVKPEQSLTEGLGEAAAMATIGGVGLGGAAGLARRPAAPEIEPPPPPSPEQPAVQPALQQQVEAITGVTRPEEVAPEMLTSEEAGRQRLLMLQQKADADAQAQAERAAREGIPPQVPEAPTPDTSKPSLNEQMPQATPRAELEAKQAEIDRLRLEAGLPTGASSKTPGVTPESITAEETPVPKIVDNRPLEERAAKNRLLVMQNMLKNQGGDPNSLTIVPHPTAEGKFAIQSLDVPVKFTKGLEGTAINRPESTPIIDPVNAYIEIARRTNTPAAMRLVKDFEAGIVTREDVEAAIAAEQRAGQPLPLNYQGNGEPWFTSAPTGKPRGERELPAGSRFVPTPEGPERPPVTIPAAQVYGEMEPPAPGTTGQPPVVEPPAPPVETPPEVEPPAPTAEKPKTLAEFQQRMPTKTNNLEVRQANEEGSFLKMAEALAKSTNPVIRRIGELGVASAAKIKLRKPVDKLVIKGQHALGVFRHIDDSIQIQRSEAGDETTNAHETLHALVVKAQYNPTPKQAPIVLEIDKLFRHVKKELNAQGMGWGRGFSKQVYGLASATEFTAEAMSNPEFQYMLMNVQYGGRRSAWTQFTRLVADLLGIKDTNALTEVLNLTDKLAMTKQPRKTKISKNTVDFAQQPVLLDASQTLFFPQSEEAKRNGYAIRLKNPITMKDGSRLSGFTDPLNQTTFYGYDKNGERFTQRREYVDPADIVSSKDSNKTAEKIRKSLQDLREFSAQTKATDLSNNPKFQKWFGDSKVVDRNGNPMVVYHGTKAFDEYGDKEGEAIRQFAGLPNWFAEEPYTASGYAGAEGTMYPVYLSIKKPLAITNFDMNDDAQAAYALAKRLGVDIPSLYLPSDAKAYNVVSSPQFVEAAQKAGYDGIKVKEGDYNTYAAFEPTQIKSATGNTGEFSTESPEIDLREAPKSVKEVKEKISTALQKQKPLAAEVMAGVTPDFTAAANRVFKPQTRTIVEKISDLQDRFWQRLAQGIADQYRTIKDYSPIGYIQARLSKTIDGALEGILFNGHVFNDGGALNIKSNTKGLIETLKPVGSEVDRYQMWVALNRESNLPEDKKSRSDDMDYMVANRKQLSEGMLNGKPRAEVYAAVLKDMNALNRSVLDVALGQGLIDQQSYNNFVRDIYYIPFYRQMEDGDLQGAQTSAGLTRQQFSKALKGGGDRPFGDLMENTLRNWSHILSASMKNQAAVTTLKDAAELDAVEPAAEAGPDTVKVMIDGKPAYFTVKDPLLLESITSIGYMGPKSKFLDISRDFKNILQYGVTMSPAFKVNNLFRDSVQSIAVSGLKKNPFANVIDGWIATDKNNPAHISALAGGAIFNFGTAYEGNQSKLIKRLLEKGVKESDILDTPDKIKAGLAKIWEKYEEAGNKSEAANRMALYNQLREQGYSHLEASFQARDLMDFSMQGSWGAFRYLTQVVPFMNARIQGLYKLGRDGIVPTGRVLYNSATGKELDLSDKKKAQAFSVVSGAVCLASLALYYGFKDDEEFQKRDNWDRDNFWWIRLPGMEAAVRIPKPFEIGALGTIAERTAEQIFDENAEGKQFTDALSRMVWDTFAMNPLPQVVKPIVDLYANKDSFTGAPIETAGMEALSKAERKTENTSPLAIALSNVINIALPEKAELSPIQTDYAIKGYFGWLGGTVATTSMYAVAPFKEGEYPDTKWMDRASLGFVKSLPSNMSQYTTSFYENNKQIQQAFADMRHYSEIGEMDKVQQIYEEKGDKIALQKLYTQTSKQMANIRKQIQVVTADTGMDGATKREQIDQMKELISMLAKQAEDTRKSFK